LVENTVPIVEPTQTPSPTIPEIELTTEQVEASTVFNPCAGMMIGKNSCGMPQQMTSHICFFHPQETFHIPMTASCSTDAAISTGRLLNARQQAQSSMQLLCDACLAIQRLVSNYKFVVTSCSDNIMTNKKQRIS